MSKQIWKNNKLNLSSNEIATLDNASTSQEELELLFKFTKSRSWIKYQRDQEKSDGLLGNIFEDLIGIQENNKRSSDYDGFEIKTRKKDSKTFLTLFNSSINSINSASTYLRENYGCPDEKHYLNILNTTVKYMNWNNHRGGYNFKLEINENIGDNLYLKIKNTETSEEVDQNKLFWEIKTINNLLAKIKNCCIVEGEINKNEKLVKFNKMTIYKDVDISKFWELLKSEYVVIDFRNGVYKSGKNYGKTHDHGTAFRIKMSKFDNLYKYKKEII